MVCNNQKTILTQWCLFIFGMRAHLLKSPKHAGIPTALKDFLDRTSFLNSFHCVLAEQLASGGIIAPKVVPMKLAKRNVNKHVSFKGKIKYNGRQCKGIYVRSCIGVLYELLFSIKDRFVLIERFGFKNHVGNPWQYKFMTKQSSGSIVLGYIRQRLRDQSSQFLVDLTQGGNGGLAPTKKCYVVMLNIYRL